MCHHTKFGEDQLDCYRDQVLRTHYACSQLVNTSRVYEWSKEAYCTREHSQCIRAVFTGAQYTEPVFMTHERGRA